MESHRLRDERSARLSREVSLESLDSMPQAHPTYGYLSGILPGERGERADRLSPPG